MQCLAASYDLQVMSHDPAQQAMLSRPRPLAPLHASGCIVHFLFLPTNLPLQRPPVPCETNMCRTSLRIYRYEMPWHAAFFTEPRVREGNQEYNDGTYGAWEQFFNQFSTDWVVSRKRGRKDMLRGAAAAPAHTSWRLCGAGKGGLLAFALACPAAFWCPTHRENSHRASLLFVPVLMSQFLGAVVTVALLALAAAAAADAHRESL